MSNQRRKEVLKCPLVYGEFILFRQTVQGIQWAIDLRQTRPNFRPDAALFVNENGNPYDTPTASGNRNQQIPNSFGRLLRRIRRNGHEIRGLSFGKLRKTAGDLIRRHSNGEISAVFLCHGKAVKSDALADCYTNRPFGRVFEAIRTVEDYLAPVFAAAGDNPFGSDS